VLVDDDPADRNLVARAVRALGRSVDLHLAEGVDEALAFVDASKRPAKTLVLLDLNLVTHDGREVIRALDARRRLDDLAVVVFTSSERQEDVSDCYRLGAKSFLHKPATYPELKAALAHVITYWFETVELPLAS
jgi:CheY-like chemotaxis protein